MRHDGDPMRRSRTDAEETRRRIVESASRLFRARGISEVSVADVMGALQMTVGGFYKHFASKEALVSEAIDSASLATTQQHRAVRKGDGRKRASALLAQYLSDFHRAHTGEGCPVAALCSEVAHETPPTREAFTAALKRLIGVVDSVVPEKAPDRRAKVLAVSAEIVGALVLARATDDRALGRALLVAARRDIDTRI